MKILGISGSLRAGSYNTHLLRAAAAELASSDTLELARIDDLPLYNSDLSEAEVLAPVERFKAAIASADALLIATPEYNYGIPGPLKNAIDWASRPAYRSVFAGKPVGVLGAAMSFVGSARAQGHLKAVLLGMASAVYPAPELLVGLAHQKFDDTGQLTDDTTREFLGKYLVGFREWVQRVGRRATLGASS